MTKRVAVFGLLMVVGCSAEPGETGANADEVVDGKTPLDIVTYEYRLQLAQPPAPRQRPEKCELELRFFSQPTKGAERIATVTTKLTDYHDALTGTFEARRYQVLSLIEYGMRCESGEVAAGFDSAKPSPGAVHANLGPALQEITGWEERGRKELGPLTKLFVGVKSSRKNPNVTAGNCPPDARDPLYIRLGSSLFRDWAKLHLPAGDDYEATVRVDESYTFQYRPKLEQFTEVAFTYCRGPGDVQVKVDLKEKDRFVDDVFRSSDALRLAPGAVGQIDHAKGDSLFSTTVTVQK